MNGDAAIRARLVGPGSFLAAGIVALVAIAGCGSSVATPSLDSRVIPTNAAGPPASASGQAPAPAPASAATGQQIPSASTAAVTAVAITAGDLHTCILTSSGGVKCWGINNAGQLGDGTTTSRDTPVDVVGLTSGVTAIDAGSLSTCAITSERTLKCWGDNTYGQLGPGSKTSYLTPIDVAAHVGPISAVAVGGFDTCVVTAAGGAKCWGRNTYGALGNGSTVDSRNPVDVVGLTRGVASVALGVDDTCALTTAGSVKCWGFLIDPHNILGPLKHTTPIPIVGLAKGVTAISVHGDTCALVGGGDLKCGGDNTYGELGDGTTKARAGFGDVIGLTKGVTAIAAGGASACAITSAGALKCWGDNALGQLGDGLENNDAALPVDVVGLASGVMAVAVGGDHACALMSAGNVKCWGAGGAGELGNGGEADSTSPVDVLLSNP